jgi:hypothetical protein
MTSRHPSVRALAARSAAAPALPVAVRFRVVQSAAVRLAAARWVVRLSRRPVGLGVVLPRAARWVVVKVAPLLLVRSLVDKSPVDRRPLVRLPAPRTWFVKPRRPVV